MKIEWKKGLWQVMLLLAAACMMLYAAHKGKGYGHAEEGLCDVQGNKEKQENTFQASRVLGSCVRIQGKGHYGSGSIYALLEEEIIIVTNKHVLQYWDEDSYVTFYNGAVGSGRVYALAEQADLGFLSINRAFLSDGETEGLSAVEKSDAALMRGDGLYLIDLASDVWHPEIYEGQVLEPRKYLEDFGMEMLYGESVFKPGMSGSGVFDGEGKYVGMLTGGTKENEIAAVLLEDIVKESAELGN